MKIHRVETWRESLALTRPYTIAFKTTEAVDLFFVRLIGDGGCVGHGCAAPAEAVTGESPQACEKALAPDSVGLLRGRDVRHLGSNLRWAAETLHKTPAARAAVDMACYDLFAQWAGVPLVDVLGRRHKRLLTSVTIGIKGVRETLEEADELVGRGFRCLKVKIGLSLEEDIERLHRLREHTGPELPIRVDANQGYDAAQTVAFCGATAALGLEFCEQPMPARQVEPMRALPEEVRVTQAADESLHNERDALLLSREPRPCSIYNIKLMKCGGIRPALSIAEVARVAGIDLMWGCMDESVISIAAALHAAYSCDATRYLDLDGSLDLARDIATGGFVLRDGYMEIPDAAGLGVAVHMAIQ